MDELKLVLSYRFYIRMLNNGVETSMHAQHVTGLSYSLNVTEFESTGGVKMMPTDVTYGNLTLKRAILEEAVPMGFSTTDLMNKLEVQQIDMAIHLLNNEGKYVRSWNISDAYTINWSTSDFDTTSNEVIIETIEFKYKVLREIT